MTSNYNDGNSKRNVNSVFLMANQELDLRSSENNLSVMLNSFPEYIWVPWVGIARIYHGLGLLQAHQHVVSSSAASY